MRQRTSMRLALLAAVPLVGLSPGPWPSVVAAASAPSTLQQAPLSEEFVRFEQRRAAGRLQLTADDGHPLGYRPEPVDLKAPAGAGVLVPTAIEPVLTPQIVALPSSFDLRTQGRVPPVKQQGVANTCWALTSITAVESGLLPVEPRDFSENNLKNTHGFDLLHNWGGNRSMAAAYLTRWSGPVDETDDPYSDISGVSPPGLPVQKRVQQIWFLPDRSATSWWSDNAAIKQAVMDHGAVMSVMYYSGTYFNDVTDAYFYNGTADGNHYVAIVGWDDNYSSSNFTKIAGVAPRVNGAWLVQSTWGTGWGAGGYCYISYDDRVIGRANAVFYGVAEPPAGLDRVYEHDPLGRVTTYAYTGSSTDWFANVFTATGNEQLTAVSWWTVDEFSSYELQVYLNPSPAPTGGAAPVVSQLGDLTHAGYHTVALQTPVALTPGTVFSVVVKLTNTGLTARVPLEARISGYSSAAAAHPGESFVGFDSAHFRDVTEVWPSENANVCIKAFTKVRDLVIDRVDPTTMSPEAGELFDVEVVVRNQGSADAGPFAVDLYPDSAVPPQAPAAGAVTLAVPGLTGGASTTVTFRDVAYPSAGSYRMWVLADRGQAQAEADEANNFGPPSGLAVWVAEPANEPPVVGDIPDQQVGAGAAFAAVPLDDYVTDANDADATIAWTTTGASALSVTIADGVATVSYPPGWSGSETITFTATDPQGANDSDAASFTVVGEPWLAGGELVPSTGSPSTAFTFSVTYTNGSNTAPGYAYAVIVKPDGSKWWFTMATTDTDYRDGSLYSYTGTLPVGAYSYYFQFLAGTTVLKTAAASGPTVSLPPSLSGGSLTPSTGTPSTAFTFAVTYTNGSNAAPGYAYVVVVKPDGSKWWYTMATTDTDYRDGSLYSCSVTLPVGAYSYYFQFLAGTVVLKTATASGPTVSMPTSLSGGALAPSTGTPSTAFAFTVTYTDGSNAAPGYAYLVISKPDGSKSWCAMATTDTDYRDGSLYSCSVTLPVGAYSYYFQFLAGTVVLKTATASGPTVSLPTSLSGGSLVPSTGTPSTAFAYAVTYTNGGNAAPGYAYLVVVKPDGSKWWYTMATTDTDYRDGSLYSCSVTLPVGAYSYYFQFLADSTVLKTVTGNGPTVQ